jgi:hypothetical protein
MTDLVLRDIDPELVERIKRLSELRGWSMHVTLATLIDRGLQACESGLHVHFSDRESTALEQAIAALRGVADDTGFGLIGRAPDAPEEAHVLDRWKDDL